MRGTPFRSGPLTAALLWLAVAPAPAHAQPDSTTSSGPGAVAAPAPEVPAAAPVRGPRIPGTTLRLGDSLSVVLGRPDLRAVADPDLHPGETAYAGTLRFYGAAGDAKLVFREGGLARATFELKHASSRTRAYVEDDLRRLGYIARCRRTMAHDRDCEWTGPLSATVVADSARLSADFGAAGVARSALASKAGGEVVTRHSLQVVLEADSTPVLPDTLDLREDNPNGYPKPTLLKGGIARIPDELRASTERGTVTVLAFVGPEGQVQYVEALAGPMLLRPVAEGAVMQYRFQRYAIKEGRRRFWVRVSVFPA